MNTLREKRKAYIVSIEHYDETKGYRAGIAVEGESGYFLTDWYWGKDYTQAQEIADQKNLALGHTLNEASDIVLSSMAA